MAVDPSFSMTQGMHPSLADIVNRIIAESDGKVTISSGFRSRQQQQELYDKYLSGTGNLAARPGTSKHEHGLAVDFGGDLGLAAQLAQKYGLVNTVPGEPWHFELADESAVGDDHYSNLGLQYDLPSESPENIIANRLNTIVSMIGMDPTVDSPGVGDEGLQPLQEFDPTTDAQFPDGFAPQQTGGIDDPNGYGAIAQNMMKRYGWGPEDYAALVQLWNRESGDRKSSAVTWNPGAANPNSSARGIAQKMTSIHGPIESSAAGQIAWGMKYIADRYGSPSAALGFHDRKGWY